MCCKKMKVFVFRPLVRETMRRFIKVTTETQIRCYSFAREAFSQSNKMHLYIVLNQRGTLVVEHLDVYNNSIRIAVNNNNDNQIHQSIRLTFNSANCSAVASPGALVNRHCPVVVFGNAMTSRMLFAPHKSMTNLSIPMANPP